MNSRIILNGIFIVKEDEKKNYYGSKKTDCTVWTGLFCLFNV